MGCPLEFCQVTCEKAATHNPVNCSCLFSQTWSIPQISCTIREPRSIFKSLLLIQYDLYLIFIKEWRGSPTTAARKARWKRSKAAQDFEVASFLQTVPYHKAKFTTKPPLSWWKYQDLFFSVQSFLCEAPFEPGVRQLHYAVYTTVSDYQICYWTCSFLMITHHLINNSPCRINKAYIQYIMPKLSAGFHPFLEIL